MIKTYAQMENIRSVYLYSNVYFFLLLLNVVLLLLILQSNVI